jgi:hypothetical protein
MAASDQPSTKAWATASPDLGWAEIVSDHEPSLEGQVSTTTEREEKKGESPVETANSIKKGVETRREGEDLQ